MTSVAEGREAKGRGLVLHAAAAYDALVWLYFFGREGAFRDRIVRLARVQCGESVLDIGCGTGSLALAARRAVGSGGTVQGIDPSPEMTARARRKARRAGVDVTFAEASADALPFADGRFDVVLSTLMLHHLPRPMRLRALGEARRVLRTGGRLLVVDFGRGSAQQRGLLARIHRHGGVPLVEIAALVTEAGLRIVASGAVGERELNYVLAEA